MDMREIKKLRYLDTHTTGSGVHYLAEVLGQRGSFLDESLLLLTLLLPVEFESRPEPGYTPTSASQQAALLVLGT